MNLKNLNDDELVASHLSAVQVERDALSVVLHHFREVDRRRLYSKLKYQSLKDYAVKHLKYSESEAWLRVAAMQLMKELPQIEAKINSGDLQLTNLVMVKRAFGQEAKQARFENSGSPERTPAEKLAVIEKLQNVSKTEAMAIISIETGVSVKAFESVRELSDGKIERKVIMDKATSMEIDHLKGLLAHSHPQMSAGDLIKLAVEALGRKINPLEKAEKKSHMKSRWNDLGMTNERLSKTVPEQAQRAKSKSARLGYIPAPVRRHVWKRDGGRCTNCGSIRAVQCEHIIPVAKGGKSTIENVKLLCRNCNQRSAVEHYGLRKMERFLREPRRRYFSSVRQVRAT